MPQTNDNYRKAYPVTTLYKSDMINIITTCMNNFPYLEVLVDERQIKSVDDMRIFEKRRVQSFLVKGYDDAHQREVLRFELTKKSAALSLSNMPDSRIGQITSQINALLRRRYASLRMFALMATGGWLPFLTYPTLSQAFGRYTIFSFSPVPLFLQLILIIILLMIQKSFRLTNHVILYFTDTRNIRMCIPFAKEIVIRFIVMVIFAKFVLFIFLGM